MSDRLLQWVQSTQLNYCSQMGEERVETKNNRKEGTMNWQMTDERFNRLL